MFDIYNEYGTNNIKTINDQAGIAPVEVDPIVIDFLLDCKEYYEMSGGRVNVAMGSVLYLWHEARNDGINNPQHAKLPDMEALQEAAPQALGVFGYKQIDPAVKLWSGWYDKPNRYAVALERSK